MKTPERPQPTWLGWDNQVGDKLPNNTGLLEEVQKAPVERFALLHGSTRQLRWGGA